MGEFSRIVVLNGVVFGGKVVLNEANASVNNVVFGGKVVVLSAVVLGCVAFSVRVFLTPKVVFGRVVL